MSGLSRRIKGFTLVELLVVIAIIIMLAALTIGGVRKARKSAELASGLAAVGNIGKAMSLYVTDHRGRVPELKSWTQFVVKEKRGPYTPNLVDRLESYLGSEGVDPKEYVPGTVSKAFLKVADPVEKAAYYVADKTKMVNGEFTSYPFGYAKRPGMQEAPGPLSVFMIAEPSSQYALIEYDAQLKRVNGKMTGSYSFLQAEPWHENKRVVLFFDWHAEAISTDANHHSDKRW